MIGPLIGEPPALRRTYAIVWIDETKAIVARFAGEHTIETIEVPHPRAGELPEGDELAQIVDLVGGADEVLIMGPESLRAVLEREYVAIFHHPERIVDVQTAHPLSEGQLVERLRKLGS